MTLYEISDLLVSQLTAMGLDAFGEAREVHFDARAIVTDPRTLQATGTAYWVSTLDGVTAADPQGLGLDWEVVQVRGFVRIIGRGRAAGTCAVVESTTQYTEVWHALEQMLAPLRAWHKEIYGCWSRLANDERTIHDWVLDDLAARQTAH